MNKKYLVTISYVETVESTIGVHISLNGLKRVTEPTLKSWERKMLLSSNIRIEDYILDLLNDTSRPTFTPVYYDYKLVTVVDEEIAKDYEDIWKEV